MVNYWKQRDRAANVARSFVSHIHASPGAARLVRKDPARPDRVIGTIGGETSSCVQSVRFVRGMNGKRVKRITCR